ncbi:MAG: sulfatase-like hydrolase/transferase [Verrucomicrobiota bacterium]
MNKPNILFILTDDHRFDTISVIGNPEIHTPNLDALAKEGTTFTNASIMGGTSPAVCMPSRAMLMTGRYLFRLDGNGARIPAEQTTMPEVFRNAGYHTHIVGKWHQDRNSLQRGFADGNRIFGFTDGWYQQYGGHWNVPVHDYDPSGEYPHETGYILAEDKCTKLPVEIGVGGVHSSEMFADAAIDYLDSRQTKQASEPAPFFLYLSFVAPHDPRHSPNEFEEMYSSENVTLPENFLPRHPFDNGELYVRDEALEAWPRREHAVRRHIADYYAMISHADAEIGRVVQKLKDCGEYDNTLIVFAGDNGLAVGQHGLMGKQNLYEHSIRVPLVFRGPGIPADVRTDSQCYLLDLFPTLCDYLKISVPESVDGLSLLPAIREPGKNLRSSHYYGYRAYQRAVRTKSHKLIENFADGKQTTQLFDLRNDPCEIRNIADDPAQQPLLASLREALEKWRQDAGDTRENEQNFWTNVDLDLNP